jgi:hypothetical protein
VLGCVLRSRRFIRLTTLGTAWTWAIGASLTWIAAGCAGLLIPESTAVDQLWYVAAVAALCPWIAVLGARRPGVRVWNWFVVLPLAAVLLWPAALSWLPRGPARPSLEAPSLVGFGLAMTMGLGNYLGTRHTVSAILTAISEFLLLRTFSVAASSETAFFRAIAALGLACAAIAALRPIMPPPPDQSPWDNLWTDFRNAFGIVWANRLAERVNAQAAKEGWTVRLGPRGFVPIRSGESVDTSRHEAEIDHTMRWLLRRFVDEPWIDARIK